MDQFQYRVVAAYSADDEAYVARVPALEGVAAHGDSLEEATHEAQVAAKLMLDALKRHGRPIPAPDAQAEEFSGQLRLRLPRALHARLSTIAKVDDISLNQLLLSFISEGLGRTESRPVAVAVAKKALVRKSAGPSKALVQRALEREAKPGRSRSPTT